MNVWLVAGRLELGGVETWGGEGSGQFVAGEASQLWWVMRCAPHCITLKPPAHPAFVSITGASGGGQGAAAGGGGQHRGGGDAAGNQPAQAEAGGWWGEGHPFKLHKWAKTNHDVACMRGSTALAQGHIVWLHSLTAPPRLAALGPSGH